ncbi:MAG: Cytosol aminopeptidase PepA, partial [uncultured Solirubrobacteraceae bacterium]
WRAARPARSPPRSSSSASSATPRGPTSTSQERRGTPAERTRQRAATEWECASWSSWRRSSPD